MKAGQWSNEQIMGLVQEASPGEKPVSTLCREKGLSEATFYSWRPKFGGMQTREVARLKELEKENARFKKLLVRRICPSSSSTFLICQIESLIPT
jgi:putative transposase